MVDASKFKIGCILIKEQLFVQSYDPYTGDYVRRDEYKRTFGTIIKVSSDGQEIHIKWGDQNHGPVQKSHLWMIAQSKVIRPATKAEIVLFKENNGL
jgi:hypothetical protein